MKNKLNKKSLRIITFIFCEENYGQVLQAYALQHYLRDNYAHQYDIKVIYGVPVTFSKRRYLLHRIVGNTVYHLWQNGKYALRAYRKKLLGKKTRKTDRAFAIKQRDFNTFKRKHIALDQDFLRHYSLCTKNCYSELEADVYITGSDQLWNEWNTVPQETLQGYEYSWLPYYTLEFAKSSAVKISYAASIGRREFKSSAQVAYFKKALQGFRAISLREQAGVEMLLSIGVESVCVPDPTMLLTREQWESLVGSSKLNLPENLKESIFIYGYGDDEFGGYELPLLLRPYGNIVAVTLTYHPTAKYNPTLEEWIVCIRDAKLVVCRSFHGACFAIMMNTPFFLCRVPSIETEKLDARFENLMRIFGLEDRIVNDLKDLEQKIQENPSIDWGTINIKLKEWRKVGEDFLTQALREI